MIFPTRMEQVGTHPEGGGAGGAGAAAAAATATSALLQD